MTKVLQPFKAPRKRTELSRPKVQASPTRQSPRRQRIADSESQTELVCRRWVVKETQEPDIIPSDNYSEAKTDRDEFNGNGERLSVEERMDRFPVAHSSQTLSNASPNIMEFEAFLEQKVAPHQPPHHEETSNQGKRKKVSKTDEYWEGVLASEKLRLSKASDTTLTPVEAMMVGLSSDEDNDNGETPLRRAANRRAKEILRSINEPHKRSPSTNNLEGASSGPSRPAIF
jgi:hypothetical protein